MKIFVKSYLSGSPFSKGALFEKEDSGEEYTVAGLLADLGVPGNEVGLIFVN